MPESKSANPAAAVSRPLRVGDLVMLKDVKDRWYRIAVIDGDGAILQGQGRYDGQTVLVPLSMVVLLEPMRCRSRDCDGPHVYGTFQPLDPNSATVWHYCLGRP